MSSHDDHEDLPVPRLSGPSLPRKIDVDNDDADDTPSRRAAGAVLFHEPLLQSGPVGPTGPVRDTGMSKEMAHSAPSKTMGSAAKKVVEPFLLQEVKTASHGWSEKQLQNIPTLPAFCTLEPTAVFVPNASATRMASRISTVLRERSMEARFESAKASCTTLEGVDFCIRFYRGRGARYNHGIIVEVQRRYGTSLVFYQDTAAILDAAKNQPSPRPAGLADSSYLPVVSDSEEDHGDMAREGPGTLDLVEKMFQHPGTHRLALETLVTFTSEAKMGTATARKVSRQLLEPGSRVGAKLVSLVIVDGNNELRSMAMEALGNALVTQDASSKTNLLSIPASKLRSVLQQDLMRCESSPRTAYLAARCLEPLLQQNEHDEQLYHALQVTKSVGQARHMALAQQASKCLEYFAR